VEPFSIRRAVNRGDVWFADWYWYRGIEEVVDEGSWNRAWVMRMWQDKRGWVSLGCLMRHQASRQGFFPVSSLGDELTLYYGGAGQTSNPKSTSPSRKVRDVQMLLNFLASIADLHVLYLAQTDVHRERMNPLNQ
jgi:hypothetical protein